MGFQMLIAQRKWEKNTLKSYFIDADSITRDCEKSSFKRNEGFILFHAQDLHKTVLSRKVSELKFLLKPLSDNTEQTGKIARKRFTRHWKETNKTR